VASGPNTPEDGNPVVYTALTAGQTSYAVQYFNEALARAELLGRGGGGAYAIQFGYELSQSSGLTLAYTEGSTVADGPRRKAAGTLALSPGTYSFLYVTQGGTVTAATQFNMTPPPTLPAASVFLGRVKTDIDNILEIDYSGRFFIQGNLLMRETADTGEPGDTPPAGVRFFTKTAGGSLYLWDGEEYHQFSLGDLVSSQATAIAVLQADMLELKGVVGRMLVEYVGTLNQLATPELYDPFTRAADNPYAVV
jgi:hypothetical protein